MSWDVWIAVALLGGAGATARFVLDGAISRRGRVSFPLGTLAINASGALVLGFLVGLSTRGDTLLLAGTATIGSYTTFSTWMLETHRLAEDGAFTSAVFNVLVTAAVGLGAALLGRAIGAQL